MGGASHSHDLEDSPRSVVGALDPRTRLIAAFAFVIVLISLRTLPALMLALLFAILLTRLADIPLRSFGHRMVHVEGFMVLVLLFLPFTVAGHARFSIGPLTATDEGFLRALILLIRINATVLAVLALLAPLEPVRLGHAMARLGLPHALVHLFLFAVRYIGVFRMETARLLEAMRARAFGPRSNLHTWRTFGNLGGMILVRSIERAERVREAMLCRAFSGRFPLSVSDAFSVADAAFAFGLAVVLAGLAMADRIT